MKPGPFIVLLALFVWVSSCMNDDDWFLMNDLQVKYDTTLQQSIKAQAGLFIVNEGNFMFDNASLSYYLIDSMKVLNDIFYRTNGIPLGDVAQSMNIKDSLGYIILNNSNKIYIIDIHTFKYVGKISGLVSPRYIHFINNHKAYITDLYAKRITIVDPLEMSITGTIDVSNNNSTFNQHSTEQMITYGSFIFTNCWSYDNKILVINSETDQVIDSIEVPIQPNSMVMDNKNKLWVLCDGGFEGNPFGYQEPALISIDPETFEIEDSLLFPLTDLPSKLSKNGNGDTLYFLNRNVYSMSIESKSPELFIESPYTSGFGGYYSIGIDPYTSEVYLADAKDQVHLGSVYRFRADGTPVDTFLAGINPGAFCFKH